MTLRDFLSVLFLITWVDPIFASLPLSSTWHESRLVIHLRLVLLAVRTARARFPRPLFLFKVYPFRSLPRFIICCTDFRFSIVLLWTPCFSCKNITTSQWLSHTKRTISDIHLSQVPQTSKNSIDGLHRRRIAGRLPPSQGTAIPPFTR